MDDNESRRDAQMEYPHTGLENEAISYWQNLFTDAECVPYPLSNSADNLRVDSVINHQLSIPSGGPMPLPDNVILYAAWALVVSRTSNAKDILFGIGNFELKGARPGTYSGIAPMRINLNEVSTVHEYLILVKECVSKSELFLKYFPAWLQTISPPNQSFYKTRTAMFSPASENLSESETGKPGDSHASPYGANALVLNIFPGKDKLVLEGHFDSNIIQDWEVTNLLNRLDFTIRALGTSALDELISNINVTTVSDLQTIWNQNRFTFEPINRCVHEVIEELAHKQPSSPAVCAWDGSLTYKELNAFATTLAIQLVNRGVIAGEVVPVCFEKSMLTPLVMLAVMKAGGAFLLLDVSLPKQRLQQIVGQTRANLVISSNDNQKIASDISSNTMVITKGVLTHTNLANEASPTHPATSPNSPAYVIFTSGSTGVPKGVLISHKNVASAFLREKALFGCDHSSRIYDFASYNFTVSLTNFFMALTRGGCLCIPSEQDRRTRFADSFLALESNTVIATPSVMTSLSPKTFPGLRLLILGGEKISAKDIIPWQHFTKTVIAYANSESTTCVVSGPGEICIENPGSIGEGLAAVTWVVDPEDHDCLLPNGCIGELLIESPLVGCGYINDAKKTAASFIEDPKWLVKGITGHPGRHGRLYKTGDLVSKGYDGRLEYVSRKDAQVKIRGQRVELGDVEYCLQDCMSDTVSTVVVDVISPDAEKVKPILAAFLLMKDGGDQENGREKSMAEITQIPSLVEDNLLERLPNYMIPTAFVNLATLPMTGTGKVNRKALRETGASLYKQSYGSDLRNTQNPNGRLLTEVEQRLADVWAEVLHVEKSRIGSEHSFLALGGDSISAVAVVAAARESGLGLSVVDILRYSRLHRVAERVFELDDIVQKDSPPFSLLGNEGLNVLRKADISSQHHFDSTMVIDAYPCTPLQEGLISLESIRPGEYVMQVIVDLNPDVSLPQFRAAWNRLYTELGILRTRIVHHARYGLLQVEMNDTIDWIEAQGLEAYLKSDKMTPMGLGQSLTRYAFIRDNTGKHRWFVWTSHHALYDGWSMSLIVEALRSTYHDNVIHRGPPFRNFIRHCLGKDQETSMNYWKNALRDYDSVPMPKLPPSVTQTTADELLDYKISRPRSNSANVTLSTLIRAAWALVAGEMANSKDVVFGATMSGRYADVNGIDKIIGPTIATVPVRIKFTGSQTVTSFLRQVQQQSLDMIPHEHFGLQNIAKLSQECQRGCRFQTLLVVQPQNEDEISSDLGTWRLAAEPHWLNTYALTLTFHLDEEFIQAKTSFDSRVVQPSTLR